MRLSEIVPEGAIHVGLEATERDEALVEILDALASSGVVKPEWKKELLDAVLERERRGSTGFGKGVAVPHVKHAHIKKMSVAITVSDRGVDFNSLDKQPVYSIFLLLSPAANPEEHLQAMEVIFKNLSNDKFRRLLRQSATAQDVRALLEDADSQRLMG